MKDWTDKFDGQRFGLRQPIAAGEYTVSGAAVRQAQWSTTERGELCIILSKDGAEYAVAVQGILAWHTQALPQGGRRLLVPEQLAHNGFAQKLRETLAGAKTLGEAKEALKALGNTKVAVGYTVPMTLYRKDGTVYDSLLMTIDLV